MNRQAFLNASQKPLAVNIPEWGGTVYVRKISAGERVKFFQSAARNENDKDLTLSEILIDAARFLQLALCDETGTRLFDDSAEDFALLDAKDNDVIDQLFNAAWEFNALDREVRKAALKNSDTSPS